MWDFSGLAKVVLVLITLAAVTAVVVGILIGASL